MRPSARRDRSRSRAPALAGLGALAGGALAAVVLGAGTTPAQAVVGAGYVALEPAASAAAASRASVRCRFGQGDVLCLRKRVLRVGPGFRRTRNVRSTAVRRLPAGSVIEAAGRGVAKVFFGRTAECRLLARGRRTTILTRRPTREFLFSQLRGETGCTMGPGGRISVKGNDALPKRGVTAAARRGPRFSAVIEADPTTDRPVQYRVRFSPRSSFTVAVRGGELSVRLATGRTVEVDGGDEMRVGLTRQDTIKSVRTQPAKFNRGELAEFAQQARAWFTLSAATVGSGSGAVTSTPPGIRCAPDCSEAYSAGTVVTLTAAPAPDSIFGGWGGACAGTTPTCRVAMDAEKRVTATFIGSFQLSVTRQGGGTGTVTSSPPGINCGGDCSETYRAGTVVTLTATPASGSTFAGWGGACSGTAPTCQVAMTASRSVTATFVVGLHQLTVTKQGSGTGTITSSPPGINCGSDCSETYGAGTVVTLTAVPDPSSVFSGWGGACSGSGSTCQVTMDAAKSVTATFTIVLHTLTVTRQGSGSGTVTSSPAGINCGADCSETYAAGTIVTLTATPASGSTFAGWGGACSGTSSTCQVIMDAAKSVTATFIGSFQLAVTKQGTGAGTVTSNPAGINCGADCSETYNGGTVVTLTATPASGSVFSSWGGACSGTSSTCQVTMDAAKSVTATFTAVGPG